MNNTHQNISQLCTDLGKDRLLVQGAGGNVSWKDQDTLWVKGSGTWLARANAENIFVPVNLSHLQQALSNSNFEITPQLIGEQRLKPSIETILHVLMPQKIVVHLHAIDALCHLVTVTSKEKIDELFKQFNASSIQYAFVDYHKPGSDLAQAVQQSLARNPKANVVFLKNHGVVVGAETVEGIYKLLQEIHELCVLPNERLEAAPLLLRSIDSEDAEYIPFPDHHVQQLALNPSLFNRLHFDWVLFPDHAVFLGPKAFTYQSWADFGLRQDSAKSPELIFIQGTGVFIKPDFNMAKSVQLYCYYDVISRVAPTAKLSPLNQTEVDALLNWDAEKLRQQMSQ